MVALDADVQKKLQEFSDKYFSGSDSEEKKEEEKQEVAKEERNGKEEMTQTEHAQQTAQQSNTSSIMKKMGIDVGTAIVPNTPKPNFREYGKRIEKTMNPENKPIQESKDEIPITIIPESSKPVKPTVMLKNDKIDSKWMNRIGDCIKNKTPRKEVGFGGEILFSNITKLFICNNTKLSKLLRQDALDGKLTRRMEKVCKYGKGAYIYNIRDIIEFGQRHELETRIFVQCASDEEAAKNKAENLAKQHGLGPNLTKIENKDKKAIEAMKYTYDEVNKKKDTKDNKTDTKNPIQSSYRPNKFVPEEIKKLHQKQIVKIDSITEEIPVEIPVSVEIFGNAVNTTFKTVVKVKIG